MDVFFDDWANLGDDDSSFGSKADNHLKVLSSLLSRSQYVVVHVHLRRVNAQSSCKTA